MKKVLFLIVLAVIAGGLAQAEGINLGDFPLGKWLDPNWNAYWELSSNNIRILDATGGVYYDFGQKTVQEFHVTAGAEGVVMSFFCVETGKKYKLTKPLANLDIVLDIDPPWNVHYQVPMKRQ